DGSCGATRPACKHPRVTAPTNLEQLLDHHAIIELRARYCRCLDHKLWDEFRQLFSDVVDIDVGTLQATDPDDFVAQVRERTAGATTVHQCTMPEVEIADDTATAVWAMSDVVERGPGDWPDGLKAFHGYGHYRDGYRRTERGWRFVSIRVERLRLDVTRA